MANSELKITIDDQGNVNLEVLDGSGKGCNTLSQPFEQAFGFDADKDSKRFKPEYHQENKPNQTRLIN
jgi:hypothetical protein